MVKQVYVMKVNVCLTTSEGEARVCFESEYLTTGEGEARVRVESEYLFHNE
jgi:hypothetical protein